jgi:hypothetical protein
MTADTVEVHKVTVMEIFFYDTLIKDCTTLLFYNQIWQNRFKIIL